MRVIGCVLAVAGVLLGGAAAAQGPKPGPERPDRVALVLGRLAKMDRVGQQAWLKRLEARDARAANIAMKPEDAAKETASVRGLLHQKMITWRVLREAIEKTDAREQEAIKQLHERYRDQVLEPHYNPAAYDQRRTAWAAVTNAWMAAGGQFEQQDRLIDWLEAAIRSASPEKIGPLPELPDFGEGAAAKSAKPPAAKKEEPAKLPAMKKEEPAKPPAVKPETPAKPPAEKKAEEPAKPQPEKKPGGGPATGTSSESRVPPPSVQTVRKPVIDEAEQPAAGPAEVNVEELGVRIAGFNMELRALEADLDESGVWDAARLAPMLERLKTLAGRRADLDLFREAVPARKRPAVTPLDSPKTATSHIGERIAAARNHASSEKFSGTEADRRAESERLDKLSRRLADAAGK